jgi:hypothetical protein
MHTNGCTQYIPACQAFIIKVNGSVSQIDFSNAARVTNYKAFNKGAKIVKNLLKVKLSDSQYSDEAGFYYTDTESSSSKMFSLSNSVPQIYIKNSEGAQSISRFAGELTQKDVFLAVSYDKSAKLTLSVSDFNFDKNVKVSLEDLKLKQTSILSSSSIYAFDYTPGDSAVRFVVHVLMNPTALPEVQEQSNVKIYSIGKQVVVSGIETQGGSIVVSDILGKIVKTVSNVGLGQTTIDLESMNSAVYVVKYVHENTIISQKVVLQ